MATRKIYIATDSDRWDILAYDFLGDASLVKPLMDANPGIPPSQMFFESGQRIVIPSIPQDQYDNVQETTNKAPWK